MNQEKEPTKVQEIIYELKVSDAMTKDVITATTETPMSELREILRTNQISGVPIVDGDQLVGIISIEDFIKWLADGGKDCPIKDKMTTDVKTFYADVPLVHAVSRFEQSGFGRFPVVDRNSGKLVGIITKGDIIERLLQELEVSYQEEEIRQYRASHIFEDIIADKTTLNFQYRVKGKDFTRAGEASSALKKTLARLGIHPHIVRRVAIATYEAEMNLVIFTQGGEILAQVKPGKIHIEVKDSGPGIRDIKKALQSGYSTASNWVRELGFGAGMGFTNIQNCADKFDLNSTVGVGTRVEISFEVNTTQSKAR